MSLGCCLVRVHIYVSSAMFCFFFPYHFPIFSLFSNLQFLNQQQIMQSFQQFKSQTTQSVISSVLAVTSTQIATGLIGQLKLDTGKSQARIVQSKLKPPRSILLPRRLWFSTRGVFLTGSRPIGSCTSTIQPSASLTRYHCCTS